jgi:peroxiredoxin
MTDTSSNSVPRRDANPIGLAVASLVLGIISVVFSLFLVGGIVAVIGAILGGIHLRKRTAFRAMAAWGTALSIVGLLISMGLGVLYYQGYKRVQAAYREGMAESGAAIENWQGVRAPEVAVTSLDGKSIRLADLRGKRVVLDFWATWCPPCVKEIPHLVRLVNDPDAKDLVVVGISDEPKERLAKFVKEKGVNYSVATAQGLPSPYKDVQSIPTTFFIDRNGVI